MINTSLRIPQIASTHPAAIPRLPSTIPAGTLASQLSAIYGFTEDDVDVVWQPSQITIDGGGASVEETCSVCAPAELPLDTTQESFRYLYWLASVRKAASDRDWAVDALQPESTVFAMRRRSSNSADVKAPADLPPNPSQPLNTPTFVPQNLNAAKFKLDESVMNAFRMNGRALAANPPEDCEDGTNPVLVYDVDNDEMAWECRKEGEGSSGGCCQLILITEAPPAGFGVGVGKLITGVNSDGSYILGEEVPVVIPSLTY